MSQDYPFPMPAQEYWGGSVSLPRNIILVLLILLFVIILALPSFAARDVMPMTPTAINRALPGSRTGVMTKAEGAMLHIDRATYTLTPFALVEDKFGTPLMIKDIQCRDVEYAVRYWVDSDHDRNHILQLVVTFPE
jgi:hypothetical protein